MVWRVEEGPSRLCAWVSTAGYKREGGKETKGRRVRTKLSGFVCGADELEVLLADAEPLEKDPGVISGDDEVATHSDGGKGSWEDGETVVRQLELIQAF